MKARGAPRINQQPAFILHQYPYRETSRLLDVFSRDHGRVMLVARGVQRPGSQLRSVLLAQQPLLLDWFGAGEVKTLHAAAWQPGMAQLAGRGLLCGLYATELIQRSMTREVAHPEVFAAYYRLLLELSRIPHDKPLMLEAALRRFERALLESCGFGIEWGQTSAGEPVLVHKRYAFSLERGVHETLADGAGGAVLLGFSREQALDERQMHELKGFMRDVLAAVLLDDSPLQTRLMMRDLLAIADDASGFGAGRLVKGTP
ncbi:DNA repair protein RecO [Chitinilyticum piscinae]|uniref:DNA repair protein RecO n=1 Tax=Chitinilyticum piscinae TaxID=2866724 RepID=A0A8J7FPI3_9NEIS|nr:DNA repair protein RecO [Chitinilyticum piscinae]MBE9609809.1 DNA repair protein RecO [Chitinilyticum piscinae]